MAVTVNSISIETVTGFVELQRPRVSTTPLGIHSLALSQHMKATIHQYQVSCVWTGGDTDFDNKKSKLQNYADGGLPVWFEATEWGKNHLIFGKLSDLEFTKQEGRPDIWDVNFLITAVFPWGYIFIVDDGAGDFRLLDVDQFVESRTINPLLRKCNYTKGANVTFSIRVKNISGSTGTVKLEMMVPDDITTGSVTVSTAPTKAVGNIGDSGISNTPGTKRRITFSKLISGGGNELWDITITIGSSKTSFIDGSLDDISG